MGKSKRPRAEERRQAQVLLGECRDLGADPHGWREHMLVGLCRLLGARVGMAGDARLVGPERTFLAAPPILVGWDEAQRQHYQEKTREDGLAKDDILRRFTQPGGRVVTRSIEEIINRRQWYRSPQFQDLMRPVQVDCNLVSIFPLDVGGRIATLSLFRALGDRWFRPRELALVHHFQLELSNLLGKELPTTDAPGIRELAPRLRQTLRCLLEGDSEKEVALQLGISALSVHDYVKALHRHFGVASRGELLALFLRRTGVFADLTASRSPTLAHPDVAALAPRLRQTLECLLAGDSEKQAAVHLGLSPATIHKNAQALYRHFQVCRRRELLAVFLQQRASNPADSCRPGPARVRRQQETPRP
jgi:DNA-binding NarL/FixJ family response regulator